MSRSVAFRTRRLPFDPRLRHEARLFRAAAALTRYYTDWLAREAMVVDRPDNGAVTVSLMIHHDNQ